MSERPYSPAMAEEELKARVAADWFGAFDCARIMGRVDFCVALPEEGRQDKQDSDRELFRQDSQDSQDLQDSARATRAPNLVNPVNPVNPVKKSPRVATTDAQSLLWAEAKKGKRDVVESLVQLILTIGRERTFDRFLPPRFLGAFDAEKIAFLPYEAVMEVFYKNDFNWEVAPSDHATREFRELRELVAPDVSRRLVVFRYAADARDLAAFIRRNFTLGGGRAEGDAPVAAVQITRNNFTHIYQRWREAVLPTIAFSDWEAAKTCGILDADFFLADILSKDNVALVPKLNVLLKSDHYRQANGVNILGQSLFADIGFTDGQKAHAQFWNRYRRPPRRDYWDFIVNRRDLLVPQDVRERKGSFFTPRRWVELSQHYLELELGEDWQDGYDVWDCCAGTGNLLAGLTNKYRVWASTLDAQDVAAMHQRIRFGANLLESHVFQFDFLNDPFEKLPPGLREIIADPARRRRLVIYINPPYAEAGNARQRSGTGKNKAGVSFESLAYRKGKPVLKTAARELFALFLYRIATEIPGCVVGQFSKLKHLQAQNFKGFREHFRGKLGRSFVVPSNTFDNVKGKYPIGFFVWRLGEGAVAPSGLDGNIIVEPGVPLRASRSAPPPSVVSSPLRGSSRREQSPTMSREAAERPQTGVERSGTPGTDENKSSREPATEKKEPAGGLLAWSCDVSPHSPASPTPSPRVSRSSASVCGNGALPLLGDAESLTNSPFAVNGGLGVFSEAELDVYDAKGQWTGTKNVYSYAGERFVIEWLRQFYDKQGERIGYLRMNGTDVQNNNGIYLASSLSPNDLHNHFYAEVTRRNVCEMCIYLAIRAVVEATWLNDREQYLFPNDGWKGDAAFQMDCLVFALFSGQNRISSADGVNHWIPFSEEEVGAQDTFASHVMSDLLHGRRAPAPAPSAPAQGELAFTINQSDISRVERAETCREAPSSTRSTRLNPVHADLSISPAARAVLDAARALYRHYHATPGANPNASYYDIRLHFQGRNAKGQMNPDSPDATYRALLASLRAAHKALAAQIAPKVYQYGFLKS